MPMSASASPRRFAPALLASTCVAALLLGAPAKAKNISVSGNPNAPAQINQAGSSITKITITNSTVTGGVANNGTIKNSQPTTAIGISGSTINGGVTNAGTITVTGSNNTFGINPFRVSKVIGGTAVGISNSGMLTVTSATGTSFGIAISGTSTVIGGSNSAGISNSGTINASAPMKRAVGILVSSSSAVIGGNNAAAIINTGTITATGKTGIGIQVIGTNAITGGITNAGTITGSTAALDFTQSTVAVTFNQQAGALNGAVNLSPNGDTFNFIGGTLNGVLNDGATGTATVNVVGGGTATMSSTAMITGVSAFTHAAGTTLVFQVTPTQAPTINASTVTLAGNFTVSATGFTVGQTASFQKVIVATKTLTNNVSVLQPNGFTIALTPEMANANALDLSVTENAAVSPPPPNTPAAAVLPPGTFAAAVTTPNQKATANAVQALGSGTLFNAVSAQPIANGPQVFNALSGEVHASTVSAAFTDATLPNTAILDRLNQPVAPPVLGAAIETTGAYAADLPTRKGPVAPVSAQFYQPRLFDLWGEGFGDWGRVSSDGNAASLSRTTGGFVLGGDVSAANFMGGDWRFGLAGGYTNDSITVNQRGSSSTFESVFGGAYAGASFGALQLRAGALYGTNTTSTTRQVAFPGFFEALSSNNGGYTAQGFGEVGYRIQLPGLGLGAGSRVTIEPFAGAAAFLIHQNGFTEVGGTSALTATARDFNVQTTTLGVRGELAFASMPLTLKGMLGWRHAYGDVVPSVLLTFQGGAQAFSTSGVPIDRDAFVAEAGIEYSLTSMLSVGVSYSGQYGQRAMDNAFKGNVNLRF
ncbi:MAG: autotransporter domain-containing protein [Hyphomicrobiales bacterium]|nr:autotransporter domain-containing protein [Hyphomicrobiales bacterium]